ncbi:MAG: polymerase sigma-B factor [Gaiellales bacterium]|nr:polymerase sigma-B factor [Gaiellales bacterium]
MSPENVERLVAAVRDGNEAAGERLVTAMRPLVEAMARRFEGRVPRSDLEQAGVVGLLWAARSFDPTLGTPFGGYAAPFVMGEMLGCVRQLAMPVRVPRSMAENQRRTTAAIEQLTSSLERSPTVAEIGRHASLDEDAVLDSLRLRMAVTPVALDELDESQLGLSDDAIRRAEQRLDLGARLGRLDARSRTVVMLRFGLELSQREIAARLGISQMHVSRLLRAALATLSADEPAGD